MSLRMHVTTLSIIILALALLSCGSGERSQPADAEEAAGGAPDAVSEEAAEQPSPTELKAEVPELDAFHEVIFQLWHDAWPDKDYALMKELLPETRRHVELVGNVELPGILRDKKADWEAGVDDLRASLTAYEEAAAADDSEGLLKSVEQLHADFERLMRMVRPVMKELDDYHVELYQIYHYYMPNQNLAELRGAATRMVEKCGALGAAPPPRWFSGEPDALSAEIETLCRRSEALATVAQGDAWPEIETAVESVHDQYVSVESLFH